MPWHHLERTSASKGDSNAAISARLPAARLWSLPRGEEAGEIQTIARSSRKQSVREMHTGDQKQRESFNAEAISCRLVTACSTDPMHRTSNIEPQVIRAATSTISSAR
jgi:hypothetical protein